MLLEQHRPNYANAPGERGSFDLLKSALAQLLFPKVEDYLYLYVGKAAQLVGKAAERKSFYCLHLRHSNVSPGIN